MTRTMSTSVLLTEVELALLAGRNLAQIEHEILASSGLDEESQPAVWLRALGSSPARVAERALPPE